MNGEKGDMENLLTLVLENNIPDSFNKVYVQSANNAEQIILYINIDNLSMIELDDIINRFIVLKRTKRAESEVIFYSFDPISEDIINVIKSYKVDYLYCGKLSNYALTLLSTLKRISGKVQIIGIDCEDENWFDYALWAVQYGNRLFFYNCEKV